MGVRDLAPPLFLRLGRDQDSYDFMKWHATTGQEGDYDWGDMDLPYLDVKDADVFEPVNLFTREYMDLAHAVAVTLIKIRLLQDVKALRDSTAVERKVPQEIIDKIRNEMVGTIIGKRKDLLEGEDHGPLIKRLQTQVKEMFESVQKSNKYFWPALMEPGDNLTAMQEAYTMGSKEHMRLVLQYSYDSWNETPGAIDIIRELSNEGGTRRFFDAQEPSGPPFLMKRPGVTM